MLVFRKILRTYLMDDPLGKTKNIVEVLSKQTEPEWCVEISH